MDEQPTNGKRRLTAEEQEQFTAGMRKAQAFSAQMTALTEKKDSSDADLYEVIRLNEEIQKVLASIEHLAPFAE